MPDERSIFDRMIDFVDYHLGGTVVNRPPRKNRHDSDQSRSGAFIGDGGSSGGFDDCGGAGDAGGGGDCGGGGDGGGGGGD